MNLLTVLPVTVLFTVAVADPLGCCLPRRFSEFILHVGGFLADNDNSSAGVIVDESISFFY